MKRLVFLIAFLILLCGHAEARPIRFIQRFSTKAFSPIDIGSLVLWLDASDASTITIATGVSQWNDKSGNNNHATQGTAGNQPTYVSTLNGKNIITFGNNAAAKYLTTGSITTTANTVAIVFKHRTAAFIDWEGAITARPAGLSHKVTASAFPVGFTGDAAVNTNISNVSQTTVSIYIDGVQVSAANFDNFAVGVSVSPVTNQHLVLITDDNGSGAEFFCVGADCFDVPGNRHWDGDIAEIVVYNRSLSLGENARLTTYLKAKWGIA